jgi:hypothetical protein
MTRLQFWVPDSFMIVTIAVIAPGLILGLIQKQTSGFSAWLDRPATVERPFY